MKPAPRARMEHCGPEWQLLSKIINSSPWHMSDPMRQMQQATNPQEECVGIHSEQKLNVGENSLEQWPNDIHPSHPTRGDWGNQTQNAPRNKIPGLVPGRKSILGRKGITQIWNGDFWVEQWNDIHPSHLTRREWWNKLKSNPPVCWRILLAQLPKFEALQLDQKKGPAWAQIGVRLECISPHTTWSLTAPDHSMSGPSYDLLPCAITPAATSSTKASSWHATQKRIAFIHWLYRIPAGYTGQTGFSLRICVLIYSDHLVTPTSNLSSKEQRVANKVFLLDTSSSQ